jgi:MSHA biogenesis protein MshQ
VLARRCGLLILLLLLALPAQAAITLVGANPATVSSGAVSSISLNKPAGVTTNDVLIAQISARGGFLTTITPPAGWTLIRRNNAGGSIIPGLGATLASALYYKVATASEAASYSFSISPSIRTSGGLLVYRGVDTTSPINTSGGQNNASSTSVTAPSITTTVANAQRIAFFATAHGNFGFTAPAGMTERYDIGTGAGPNGAANMAADLTQASAGASGSVTATAGASAYNIGQQIALTPAAVVAPAPGGFNAFETSTATGAISGVIQTKIAGTAWSLDIVALDSAQTAVETGFTGDVTVDLLANTTTGIALDADNCPGSGTTLAVGTATITGGRSTANFPAVSDAWKDVRVRIRYPTSAPTLTRCSNDNFAIRPASFSNATATDADWENAGSTRTLDDTTTTGSVTHKAGRPFRISASAVNSAGATTTNYNGTPSASLIACVQPASGCSTGTFSSGTLGVAAGVVSSSTASYTEAGAFSFQFSDTSFADVDAADTTLANRTISSSSANAGRFVPDYFDVTLTTHGCAGSSPAFTYSGQPFTVTATARNSAGAITVNYHGPTGLAKDTTFSNAGAASNFTNHILAGTDYANGLGTNSQITYTFPAAETAPLALALRATDSDGVSSSGHTEETTTIRSGRLRLVNGYGSELLDLAMPLYAEFYQDTTAGFVANVADTCTTVTLTFGNYLGNLASGETCVRDSGSPGLSGQGCATAAAPAQQFVEPPQNGSFNLNLQAPGAGNDGSVDITVQGPAWLRYDWNGDATPEDASGRASFGLYSGSGRQIDRREVY